jgi:electron transfer flavoprotein beta subunit
LPEILKAKKKPLSTVTLSEMGITPKARLKVLRTEPPSTRQAGRIVKDVAELVATLKEKGVLA